MEKAKEMKQFENSVNHETPKRRTSCTPIIQVTYRATEKGDVSGSINSDTPARDYKQLPLHRQTPASLSSRWFLQSPRVQTLSISENTIDTNLKGLHLTRFTNTNQTEITEQEPSRVAFKKLISTPNRESCSQRPVFNPFESDILDTMNCSFLSPSVFSKVVTPSKEENGDAFSWGVDNIAILYPADIEENVTGESLPAPLDPDMEDRVQHAINLFFAQKSFAPSPCFRREMFEPLISPNLISPLPSTTTSSDVTIEEGKKEKEVDQNELLEVESNLQKKDVWCQTILTIPLHVDLEHLLSRFYTFNHDQMQCGHSVENDAQAISKAESSDSRERLSISSLRRKLFVNYEERATTTPVLASTMDQHMDDPIFRLNLSPRTPDQKNMPLISSVGHYSSSPIALDQGVKNRTTITPPTTINSPEVSPIKLSARCKGGFIDAGNKMIYTPKFHSDIPIANQYFRHSGLTVLKRLTCNDNAVEVYQEAVTDNQPFPPNDATPKTTLMDISCEQCSDPLTARMSVQDIGYHTMISGSSSQEMTQPCSEYKTCSQSPGPKVTIDSHAVKLTPNKNIETLKCDRVDNMNDSSAMMWSPMKVSTPSGRDFHAS